MRQVNVVYCGWGEQWPLGRLADDGRTLLFEYAPEALAQGLDVVAVRQSGVVVENALESRDASANPALVLEWTAIRIWGLMHK